MDVVRLGLPYTTTYLPDTLIEGYSSFIWTERFQSPGEFELKTPYVTKMLGLLPEMALISHLETGTVMMVEDHVITKNADGIAELTVTGRSLDAFLEHRFIEADYQKKRNMARKYTLAGASLVLIWQAVANGSGKDVTYKTDKTWPTLDVIPNTVVTDSTTSDPATSGNRQLEQGGLYDPLMDFLSRGDMGLRVLRPRTGNNAEVVSVTVNPLASRGTVTKVLTNNISGLRFDIYDGVDKSATVKFSYLDGDVNNPNYLFSVKNFKTVLERVTKTGGNDLYRNATEQAYTGLRRRVGTLDGGDLTIPEEPKPPKHFRRSATRAQRAAYYDKMDAYLDAHDAWELEQAAILEEFKNDTDGQSKHNLAAKNRISVFTGDISPLAAYQYLVNYNLGDLVMLQGEYDVAQKMLVSEYTFTEDNEGDRGFPGLTLP